MDMEELRRFFAAVQPPAGHRCLARKIGVDPETGRSLFKHWFAPSIDGLIALYDRFRDPPSYHSVNSFIEPRRLKQNAQLFKCTYLDIDIRPGKDHYKDVNQILEALRPIEEEIGQEGLIVETGGGVHVYYPYHESVESRIWWSDTHYILSLFQQYGFKGVDRGCSRDSARLLRTPGTVNEKYQKPVAILRWHSKLREPIRTPKLTIELEGADRALQDRRYKHLRGDDIVSVCGHYKRFKISPEKLSYNEWLSCLSGLRRIPDGERTSIEWTRQDPRYQDDDYVLDKLDTLTGKDATACKTFLALDPDNSPCKNCKFKDFGLNPLKAALRSIQSSIPVVEPEDMPLPPEYTLKGNAIHVIGKTDKPGDIGAVISFNPYYVKGLFMDPATHEQTILFRYQEALSDRWEEISVPQTKALVNGGPSELAKKINLNPRTTHEYISRALNLYETNCRQQGASAMLPLAKQIGWIWIKDQGYKFMYSKRVIDERGLWRETVAPENDARLHELTKSLEPIAKDAEQEELLFRDWQKLAFEYCADETVPNACKVVFLMGFVAPVVRLCVEGYRIGGAVVMIHSSTSTGKTTALRAAAGIWGKPGIGDSFGLIPPIDISEAAAYHNFALQPHLPCFVDEFTSSKMAQSAQGIHDFIKAFADGSAPARMNQDGTQRLGRKWNTICLATSNERPTITLRTLAGQQDSEAAEMRVIDMEAPGPVPYSTKYDGFSKLYGLAGPRWIKHLCSKDVQARLYKWTEEHQEDQLPPKARYIRKVIALAEWTSRELWTWKGQSEVQDWCAQIVPFGPNLIEWLRESQKEAVRESEKVRRLSNMEICVLQFLHEDRFNLMSYASAPAGDYRKMTPKAVQQRFIPLDEASRAVDRRGSVSHCWVEDEGKFYIPHVAIKLVYEKRIKTRSFTADMERFKKTHDLKPRRLHLGGMTQIERPEVACYGFSRQLIEEWQSLDSGRDED